ncbi:MAG: FixH family protein [Gemmatimonadales bacterium]|nr:FixH family protein [Gemmatimonadales bacterium]
MTAPARPSRGLGWPTAIVAVLALTVGANIWVIRLATNDPTFAIEPDYYRKAVRWDDTQAQRARNARLGWSLEPVLHAATAGGPAELVVRLADPAGQPVRGAALRVTARHNAHRDAGVAATLAEQPDGSYRGALPLRFGGEWHLQFEARRAHDAFTAESRIDAGRA